MVGGRKREFKKAIASSLVEEEGGGEGLKQEEEEGEATAVEEEGEEEEGEEVDGSEYEVIEDADEVEMGLGWDIGSSANSGSRLRTCWATDA